MILLIIGSSTEPALFHVGCRPSLHVGLFQHLYLINTWYEEWLIISIWSTHDVKIDTALTSNQHMIRRMARPTLTSDLLIRKARHLHLINTWYEKWLNISIWSTHDAKIDTALTYDQHMIRIMAHPALTSNLLIRKACPALTSDHAGTNPIIISKRPSTYI